MILVVLLTLSLYFFAAACLVASFVWRGPGGPGGPGPGPGPVVNPVCKWARAPYSTEENDVILRLEALAQQFVKHVTATYPNDPRARALAQWNGRVFPSSRDTGATYTSGCLVVNPTYETAKLQQQRGQSATPVGFDDFDRLVTRTLHELAHTTSGLHDPLFYDTHRWFLRIATENLQWPIKVNCRICCGLDAPCRPREICPKCQWLETRCRKQTNCGAL